jgi:type IV pilus assembly protein PilW
VLAQRQLQRVFDVLIPRTSGRRRSTAFQRGLSIVELMVGVTVGLFIVGGALTLFTRNIINSRHMLAETRLNEDLRSAVDLMTRDLRRAGYWGNAIQGTIAVGATSSTVSNPYGSVTTPSATEIDYAFSTDPTTEDNALDNYEKFGIRLNSSTGVLQLQTSNGSWSDVTDASSLTITSLSITPTTTTLPLGQFCAKVCGVGTPNCPTVTVRSFAIVVSGRSVSDSTLKRSLHSTVRVRNDQISGTCPS